jgi:hypothetical protein
MHDRITAGNGAAQSIHPQQVASDGFGGQPGKILEPAGGTNEDA